MLWGLGGGGGGCTLHFIHFIQLQFILKLLYGTISWSPSSLTCVQHTQADLRSNLHISWPLAFGKNNPTVCSLACRWHLREAFSIESGQLKDNFFCSQKYFKLHNCLQNKAVIFLNIVRITLSPFYSLNLQNLLHNNHCTC